MSDINEIKVTEITNTSTDTKTTKAEIKPNENNKLVRTPNSDTAELSTQNNKKKALKVAGIITLLTGGAVIADFAFNKGKATKHLEQGIKELFGHKPLNKDGIPPTDDTQRLKEKAEQEVKEKAEQEAKEKAEQEAKQKTEAETKQKTEEESKKEAANKSEKKGKKSGGGSGGSSISGGGSGRRASGSGSGGLDLNSNPNNLPAVITEDSTKELKDAIEFSRKRRAELARNIINQPRLSDIFRGLSTAKAIDQMTEHELQVEYNALKNAVKGIGENHPATQRFIEIEGEMVNRGIVEKESAISLDRSYFQTVERTERKADIVAEDTVRQTERAAEPSVEKPVQEIADSINIEFDGLSEVDKLLIEREGLKSAGHNDSSIRNRIAEIDNQLSLMGKKDAILEQNEANLIRIEIVSDKTRAEGWKKLLSQDLETESKLLQEMEEFGIKPLEMSNEEMFLQGRYLRDQRSLQYYKNQNNTDMINQYEKNLKQDIKDLEQIGKKPIELTSEEIKLQTELIEIKYVITRDKSYIEDYEKRYSESVEKLKNLLKNSESQTGTENTIRQTERIVEPGAENAARATSDEIQAAAQKEINALKDTLKAENEEIIQLLELEKDAIFGAKIKKDGSIMPYIKRPNGNLVIHEEGSWQEIKILDSGEIELIKGYGKAPTPIDMPIIAYFKKNTTGNTEPAMERVLTFDNAHKEYMIASEDIVSFHRISDNGLLIELDAKTGEIIRENEKSEMKEYLDRIMPDWME